MEVKGTAVLAIRDYVNNNHENQYENWLNNLPEESKEIFLDYIDSSAWYSIESGAIQPTLKLSDLFYDGDFQKGAWEAGRYSAQKGLTGIYKIYVKAATPLHIISRASRVFGTYYRPCKMILVDKNPKSALVEISQMDHCHDVIKYRIGGWTQRALEISGAKDVNVNFEEQVIDNQKIFKMIIKWD